MEEGWKEESLHPHPADSLSSLSRHAWRRRRRRKGIRWPNAKAKRDTTVLSQKMLEINGDMSPFVKLK